MMIIKIAGSLIRRLEGKSYLEDLPFILVYRVSGFCVCWLSRGGEGGFIFMASVFISTSIDHPGGFLGFKLITLMGLLSQR